MRLESIKRHSTHGHGEYFLGGTSIPAPSCRPSYAHVRRIFVETPQTLIELQKAPHPGQRKSNQGGGWLRMEEKGRFQGTLNQKANGLSRGKLRSCHLRLEESPKLKPNIVQRLMSDSSTWIATGHANSQCFLRSKRSSFAPASGMGQAKVASHLKPSQRWLFDRLTSSIAVDEML